jgi:hypothetical protein
MATVMRILMAAVIVAWSGAANATSWTVCKNENAENCPLHCVGEPIGFDPSTAVWDGCNGRKYLPNGHHAWVHFHHWVEPPKIDINCPETRNTK